MNKGLYAALVLVVSCLLTTGCSGAPESSLLVEREIEEIDMPCSAHSDCESNECVPTVVHLPGTTGQCWDNAFTGCATVDFESWVKTAMCGERNLMVCQPDLTSDMQHACVPPEGGSAPWIANFMCCDPLL
jgi:hypothetical protein